MTKEETLRTAREHAMARYLAAWHGETDLDTIDELVTDDYVGHMGFGNRGLAELKSRCGQQRVSGAASAVLS